MHKVDDNLSLFQHSSFANVVEPPLIWVAQVFGNGLCSLWHMCLWLLTTDTCLAPKQGGLVLPYLVQVR